MATQIQIKRGSTTPAGLTVGESAMNTNTNQIYLGGTGGTVLVGGEVTGGVDMGAGSAVSANRIPTQSGVYNYVRNSTVTSFNGLTGAVGGVCAAQANTFTALQSFSAGISASGGVTFTGTFSGATGSFSKLLTLSNGLSAAGGFTVGNDISVFGIRVGRGNRGASAGGDTNLAVGANALNSVIPNPASFLGIYNLAFGTSALQNTTSGGYNSAFGTEALYTNTSGYGNIAFGVHALRLNTTGVENCAFGGGPMYQNTTGSYNVAIGSLAYYFKSTGNNNVAIGFQAGYKFGTPTGSNVTSATNCTLIGNYATPLVNGASNEIVIGYEAIGKGSNTVSIGNSSITATHLTGLVNISSGLSAAGSTFSSTTNTLDVIASTEGAGLRIAKAVTGANSRVGGIRLGRSGTTAQNTYLEGSAGAFAIYNGVDNTATNLASFSASAFSIGATTATSLSLNCPGTVVIGDASGAGTLHGQKFSLVGSTRFFAFGDNSGTTAGFVGINRAVDGLCGDYSLEVNSPTGKGLQLIYNDHTGAASNWVNMDVSSGGNYTLRPSGGLATVTGTLNVSAGVCAAGATFSGNVTATGSIVGNQTINPQTESYTLALTDNGKIITMNSASGITATIPLNSSVEFPTGCSVTVVGIGTGVVGFTGSAGVTLRFTPGNILRAQYSAATCVKLATDEWLLLGDLTA